MAFQLDPDVEDKLIEIRDDESRPMPERMAADATWRSLLQQDLMDAIDTFNADTAKFAQPIADLTASIQKLKDASSLFGLPAFKTLFTDTAQAFQNAPTMKSAHDAPADETAPTNDEKSEAPSGAPQSMPSGQATVPLTAPAPSKSTKYTNLVDEYIRFFQGADYSSKRKSVASLATVALKHKSDYEQVGQTLNIPWWFIAGCHLLESTFNFNTHLHNGDPLTARTVHEPKGRPIAAPAKNGIYSWVESATDALKLKGFDNQADWSLARCLYRWELNNGMGYRSRGVPSPYLWSFSSIYRAGKFVADHVFSATAVSQQCGAAVLLKYLADSGHVDLGLDYVAETEKQMSSNFNAESKKVTQQSPTVDGPVPNNSDFTAFVTAHLPNLRHFKPGEFLIKGAANAKNGLNTDPPHELWPNIIKVIEILDEFRERFGHPVVLNSVYRSEAYNQAVGGKSGSQHKKFQAADFCVPEAGTPAAWAAVVRDMRSKNFFQGGIGVYDTFVHVDARGWDANW